MSEVSDAGPGDQGLEAPAQQAAAGMAVELVFGFDFGIKRIGIAMGNTLTARAQPLAVIKAIDNAARFAQIGALIAEWRPARLIVGEVQPRRLALAVPVRAFAASSPVTTAPSMKPCHM